MSLLKVLIFLPLLYAFTFNPMSQSIELEDKQKSAQFLLENDTNEKLAIELTVKNRSMDSEGKETLSETKEITVFPPQLIIPPKEKRTIRVNWNGPKELKDEKSFRVIAEQLSVNVDEKTKRRSGIQMLMRYEAALYVNPKDSESKIKVEAVESKDKNLRITIDNSGNKHQILSDPTLTLITPKDKYILKGSDLKGLSGENVLAGQKRIFMIHSDKVIPKETTGTIKLNE